MTFKQIFYYIVDPISNISKQTPYLTTGFILDFQEKSLLKSSKHTSLAPGGAGAPIRPDPAARRRVGNIAEAKPEALQLMWMPEKAGKYELEVRDRWGGAPAPR